MTSNNPNEIIESFEEKERISTKKHKKKPRTKKSDHKHIYDKYVIVEVKMSYWVPNKHESTRFETYRKCNVCGKLDWSKLPDYMYNDLEETFNNSLNFKYFHISIGFEEAKYLEERYPNLIEVSYLEK